MPAKTVKLYPTPENFQHSADDEVALSWAVAHLQQILRQSDDDGQVERQSQTVRGWKGISVFHRRTPTAEEELAERIERVEKALAMVRSSIKRSVDSNVGLSAEATAEIAAALRGL